MKIVNNSDGKPYYTQRNNELFPSSACNVTSMVSGLAAAGWPFAAGKYRQPEDNLMDFIRSNPTVKKRWDVIDPQHTTPPNQIHELICLGTNLWIEHLKGPKIELLWQLYPSDVVKIIDEGGAVVMSGRFQDSKIGYLGHIVAVVGYQATDAGEITHFIIDDPWGDYETLYRVQRGDDVFMPLSDWLSMMREQKNPYKFGHVIKKFKTQGTECGG